MKSWKKNHQKKKKKKNPKVALPRMGQKERALGRGHGDHEGKHAMDGGVNVNIPLLSCSAKGKQDHHSSYPLSSQWAPTQLVWSHDSWFPFLLLSRKASGPLLPIHHISIALKKYVSKVTDFTQPLENIFYSQYPSPWPKLSGDPTRDVEAQFSEWAF